MKIAGIFDTNEQTVGYRLAGIKTFFVNTKDALENALIEVKKDEDIGILMFNENTYNMAKDEIEKMKKEKLPLILKV